MLADTKIGLLDRDITDAFTGELSVREVTDEIDMLVLGTGFVTQVSGVIQITESGREHLMSKTKRLSFHWHMLLTRLSEYGETGVDVSSFTDLMGDGVVGKSQVEGMLSSMAKAEVDYYEVIGQSNRIRITEAGRRALNK
jgi:hypothetical protein